MNQIEEAMNRAMSSKDHYTEPTPETQPKGKVVSQNVQGITAVLEEEAQQRASKREEAQLVGVPQKNYFKGHLPE